MELPDGRWYDPAARAYTDVDGNPLVATPPPVQAQVAISATPLAQTEATWVPPAQAPTYTPGQATVTPPEKPAKGSRFKKTQDAQDAAAQAAPAPEPTPAPNGSAPSLEPPADLDGILAGFIPQTPQ
jgi:hypothetical protein